MRFEWARGKGCLCSLRRASRFSVALILISIVAVCSAALPMANALTRVGALTLNTGENTLYSAVIDTANGYAYFGTETAPGIVVKVETNRRPAAPVGGVFTPVNKLAILAPYLALIGLLGAVTVAVVTKRRRKA